MENTGRNNGKNLTRIPWSLVFFTAQILVPCLPAQASSPDDILVIANKETPRQDISLTELREFFLRKRHSWGPGQKAVPIHAKSSTRLRDVFNSKVLNMSIEEELKYWQTRKIKYGDSSLPEFGNNLKAVFKIRGSMSYVFRSQYREGVAKILLVIPAD